MSVIEADEPAWPTDRSVRLHEVAERGAGALTILRGILAVVLLFEADRVYDLVDTI